MKLVSTEFRENSIELIYADNPDLEAAAMLLHVRLPRAVEQDKSPALNRYWALAELQEFLRKQMEDDLKTSRGVG